MPWPRYGLINTLFVAAGRTSRTQAAECKFETVSCINLDRKNPLTILLLTNTLRCNKRHVTFQVGMLRVSHIPALT